MKKYDIGFKEDGFVVMEEKVVQILERKEEIEKQYKQLNDVKQAIKNAMKNNNVKRAKFGKYQLTYTPEGTSTRLDTDEAKRKLSMFGVLTECLKEVPTSDRLTITIKGDEDDDE